MASTRNGKTPILLITRSKQICNYNYSINEFTSSELDAAEGLLQLNPHSLPPHKEEKSRCLLSRRPVLPSWCRRRRRTVGLVTHPSSSSLQAKPPLLGSSKVATGDKISSPSSSCMSPNTPLLFPDDNGVNDANLVEGTKTIPFSAAEAGGRTPLPFFTSAADYLPKSSKLNYNRMTETKVTFNDLPRQHELLKHVEQAANTKCYHQLLQKRKAQEEKVEEEKKHRKLVLKIKYSDASVMPKNLNFRMDLPPNPPTCCSRSNQQIEGTNHL